MIPAPFTAREMWRNVRLCARYLDRTAPFWWKNQATLIALTRDQSMTIQRCWRQAVRQRIGL